MLCIGSLKEPRLAVCEGGGGDKNVAVCLFSKNMCREIKKEDKLKSVNNPQSNKKI